MQSAPRVAITVLFLLAASCRSRGLVDGGSDGSSEPARGSGVRASPAPPEPAASRPGALDGLGALSPREANSHTLAAKLCDVLHGLPARRKGECCSSEPTPPLLAECTRLLSASLDAKAIALDDDAVERCRAATGEALTGCAWVTPTPPLAPDACQDLVTGKLASGRVCRSSLECEGKAHCAGSSPGKTGICTPPGSVGAGCGTHVDVLATFLLERHLAQSHPFCSEFCSLTQHKCAPFPLEGAACFASVNCAPGQVCVTGRCSTSSPATEGQACGAVPCQAGLRCADKRCARPAAPGEECLVDDDCKMGGCVERGDGRRACGAKCAASLDALAPRDGGVKMGLPRAPRPSNPDRR